MRLNFTSLWKEMPVLYESDEEFSSDASVDEEEASGANEYRQVLLQQSVTMLAYMDRTTHNTTVATGISEPKMLLGFSVHDLPILIGAAVGAAGLIIIILTAVIIWHCCRLRGRHDKAYCLDNSSPDDTFMKQNGGSIVHSDSVVFLGSKRSQVTTRTIGKGSNVFQSPLTRSQSFQEKNELTASIEGEKKVPKKRPNSQPVPMCSLFSQMCSPKRAQSIHSHYYQNQMDGALENGGALGLPSIPEVVLMSSETLHDAPPLSLYASCNALDGPYAYSSLYSTLDSNASMKTRSLPSWGRSRPRPLSTEDDLNELYAKVSFSKKRKNRMRSDSAAAIAANKSRSTHMTLPYAHKDTDSLVDNEAVVVYDERTAL